MGSKQKYERPYLKKLNANALNKFGAPSLPQPMSAIEGQSVKGLIEQFGSPLFVLSESQIRNNMRSAHRAFKTRYPSVQFAWSYKTNYLKAICNIFHQEDSWAEVVSGMEYRKALGNGVPGTKIIFNGPAKTEHDLVLAVENDSLIHIDHLDELFVLLGLSERLSAKPRVAIRVNMDTGVYPLWDRFGFNYENDEAWGAINEIMGSDKLHLAGLHCHIGTFVLSTSAYRVAALKMCELASRYKKRFNHIIEYIDMGGGFPSSNTLKGAYLPGVDTVPSLDEFAEVITSAIQNYGFPREEMPLLVLECGRSLIDDAGYLLGTVAATKRLNDGKRAVILDFGVNTLFTSFWYDHQVIPAQDFSQHTENTALYGPLCMNIDLIRENINLPLLTRGDHVVVPKIGAYNMTQWMQFITTRPGIVLIDEQGHMHQLRLPETLEYLEAPEIVPEHLKLAK
jgi:diaminopimelate decarboxylase